MQTGRGVYEFFQTLTRVTTSAEFSCFKTMLKFMEYVYGAFSSFMSEIRMSANLYWSKPVFKGGEYVAI